MDRGTVVRYETHLDARLPLALADLHATLAPGAPVELQVVAGNDEEPAGALDDVVVGGGFTIEAVAHAADGVGITVRRARTLADTVGSGVRLLICGLNPSVYSADRGIGFARPGNRFWPAMVAAGLVDAPLDPRRALVERSIGMTDLCKRATVASAELTKVEYCDGAARVARMVAWLRPGAVCFVGLEGWRAAIDRRAVAGVQDAGFGGRPAYLMPSTSGLNAHTQLPALVAHLAAAAELADRS